MVYRVLGFACALFALLVLMNGTALAQKNNTHDGKVVSVKGDKLTMEGANGKEHTHDVAATAKITVDGKEARLLDLKSGTRVRVTVDDTNHATRIQAFLKTEPPKQ
jgi:hypothetical protein